MPTKIYFGSGKRSLLPELLKLSGWRRVGFVVDHGLREVTMISELLKALVSSSIEPVVGWCTMSEPTYTFLDDFRKTFEHSKIDGVIGIGGGSALDAAKAVAVLVNNRAPAIAYRGVDKMTEPVLPIAAMPTTAGTGSEITPNASFIDTVERRKLGINGEAVRPRLAILDPELTLSCPVRASVSAAVDSMVHATEAYVAKKTNPIARLFALEGFRLVAGNLGRMMKEPANLDVRVELLYGSFLSGVALMHSGTGPAAAMSYPLGVLHGVPHGIGGATFLPYVAAYNVRHGFHDYADLYVAVAGADARGDVPTQAAAFCARLIELWREIGVGDDLSSLGIDEAVFIEQTLLLQAALDQNPVPFGREEIGGVLRQLKATA